MRKVDYEIAKESFEDMLKAERFNPCLEMTFRDRRGTHTHKISAGYRDDISAFRENVTTYILSHNPGLGYAGIEVFEGDEKINDVFLQGEQMLDLFGDDELTPFEMIYQLKDLI